MILSRRRRTRWPDTLVLAAAIVCGACGIDSGPREPEFNVTWTLDPSPAVVGPAILNLQLAHRTNGPVKGATVRLEGHMTHAGMAPVLASATERTPGRYEIPLTFTMQGDWVLLVSGQTSDGRRIEHRIDINNVRPSG